MHSMHEGRKAIPCIQWLILGDVREEPKPSEKSKSYVLLYQKFNNRSPIELSGAVKTCVAPAHPAH